MVPPGMRGYFYPTAFTARCSAFHECSVCHGCTRFNIDELACRWCERGHKMALVCKHSPETRNKMQAIQEVIGPMFSLGRKTGSVTLADLDSNPDAVHMAEQLGLSGQIK